MDIEYQTAEVNFAVTDDMVSEQTQEIEKLEPHQREAYRRLCPPELLQSSGGE